jgi:hypothetical protein
LHLTQKINSTYIQVYLLFRIHVKMSISIDTIRYAVATIERVYNRRGLEKLILQHAREEARGVAVAVAATVAVVDYGLLL